MPACKRNTFALENISHASSSCFSPGPVAALNAPHVELGEGGQAKSPIEAWASQVHAELELEVPVEHGLLLENLLDLAHAPFTHTSTFAKGWPIPDVVKFHEAQRLGGNWEPYPINMSFQPPCCVNSTIGKRCVTE